MHNLAINGKGKSVGSWLIFTLKMANKVMCVCMYVCVIKNSNTTSEISTDTAGAAYNSVRDDNHVAIVVWPC